MYIHTRLCIPFSFHSQFLLLEFQVNLYDGYINKGKVDIDGERVKDLLGSK